MSDNTPQLYALAADDPVLGISIVKAVDESRVDDEIASMVGSGYRNIRLQPAIADPA